MDTLPAPIVYGNIELVVSAQGRKQDSMLHWVTEYWQTRVLGSPAGTTRGKRDDLQLFLSFFTNVVASDYVDDWTPSLSKAFKAWLQNADPKPKRKDEPATNCVLLERKGVKPDGIISVEPGAAGECLRPDRRGHVEFAVHEGGRFTVRTTFNGYKDRVKKVNVKPGTKEKVYLILEAEG